VPDVTRDRQSEQDFRANSAPPSFSTTKNSLADGPGFSHIARDNRDQGAKPGPCLAPRPGPLMPFWRRDRPFPGRRTSRLAGFRRTSFRAASSYLDRPLGRFGSLRSPQFPDNSGRPATPHRGKPAEDPKGTFCSAAGPAPLVIGPPTSISSFFSGRSTTRELVSFLLGRANDLGPGGPFSGSAQPRELVRFRTDEKKRGHGHEGIRVDCLGPKECNWLLDKGPAGVSDAG